MTASLRIIPAREAGWSAVEGVMRAEATSRNCWCQFHALPNRDWAVSTVDSRRELFEEEVERLDPPRGLVALDDADPVGWVGVEPRARLAHVTTSRLVAANSPDALDDAGVWTVFCILVPPASRRRGIANAMLDAAIAHAAAAGATTIEGLPMDTDARAGTSMSGFSTGTLRQFTARGFAPIASLPSGRTYVRRTV